MLLLHINVGLICVYFTKTLPSFPRCNLREVFLLSNIVQSQFSKMNSVCVIRCYKIAAVICRNLTSNYFILKNSSSEEWI